MACMCMLSPVKSIRLPNNQFSGVSWLVSLAPSSVHAGDAVDFTWVYYKNRQYWRRRIVPARRHYQIAARRWLRRRRDGPIDASSIMKDERGVSSMPATYVPGQSAPHLRHMSKDERFRRAKTLQYTSAGPGCWRIAWHFTACMAYHMRCFHSLDIWSSHLKHHRLSPSCNAPSVIIFHVKMMNSADELINYQCQIETSPHLERNMTLLATFEVISQPAMAIFLRSSFILAFASRYATCIHLKIKVGQKYARFSARRISSSSGATKSWPISFLLASPALYCQLNGCLRISMQSVASTPETNWLSP